VFLDQLDQAGRVRETVVAQRDDRAFRAGLDPLDAGFAAIALDRDDLQQVLDLGRQRAEAVDQLGGEGVALAAAVELRDAAIKAEAVIYSIGVGDDYYGGVNKGSLSKVSERTGGRAYFPRDERELREAFKQIQEEMRSQYLLAYEPSNPTKDGTYRKIEIQLTNPELVKQKIKLTHRQGYFAKTGGKK